MNETISIAGLVRGREKRGLTVRVVRKWIVRENSGKGDPLYAGIIIADAQGDSLYAEIPQQLLATKEQLIEIGNVYVFKKFNVQSSKQAFKAIERELMIEISKYTTMDPAREYPPSIPQYVYTITPFEAMVPAGQTIISYVDTIGYITEYTDLESRVPRGKEKVTHLRKLYLKDLNDNAIKLTMWGDFAINFNIDNIYNEKLGNVIVCLVVGCVPRQEYKDSGNLYLSASSPFCYYFNPQIPEAAAFYTRFQDVPVYIKRPATSTVVTPAMMMDKPLQLMKIAQLDAIEDPYDFEDGAYKCSVTITSIPTNTSWWYMSCKRHKNKALQQSDMTYKCPICSSLATHTRYSLCFMAKDDTAEARFFAYDENASKIVGRDCDAIMSPLAQSRGLPPQLQNIVGKQYVFSVNLSNSAIRQYVVKAVLQRPIRRPGQSEGSTSSTQAPTMTTQLMQSPSTPISALRTQSPQTPMNTLQQTLTPSTVIGSAQSTPGNDAAKSAACKKLFGVNSDNEEEQSEEASQSDDSDINTSTSDSAPPKGKRVKSRGTASGYKTSQKKKKA